VEYVEHSDRIVSQALRCSQRHRDLFIKSETAHGIELLHLPYVPCISRSARRWESLRAIRPRGVLQRWGFIGMFDSVAEQIGYQARWNPNYTPPEAPLQVAHQRVGPPAQPVVAAWKLFDEAAGHIPAITISAYYIGPCFLGP